VINLVQYQVIGPVEWRAFTNYHSGLSVCGFWSLKN